jgi:hypothetical protein
MKSLSTSVISLLAGAVRELAIGKISHIGSPTTFALLFVISSPREMS